MQLTARYVPRRLLPGLAGSLALAALGVAAAVAGDVEMGWVLALFMLWSAAAAARRMRRRGPVLTIDEHGVHDHRIPVTVAWSQVAVVRLLDRRVLITRIPMLELVPVRPFTRDRGSVALAVLRGDVALVDARDRARVVVDLQHLDRTSEEIMAAARAARRATGPATPA